MLLTGACGGGKTAMFQTLRSGEVFLDRTVTSMDVNEARIEVRSEKLGKSKRARLVDLPGHPRLRAKLDRYANGAKAIAALCAVRASLTSVRASPELQPNGPALTHFLPRVHRLMLAATVLTKRPLSSSSLR